LEEGDARHLRAVRTDCLKSLYGFSLDNHR
jgi:hypothetical protein